MCGTKELSRCIMTIKNKRKFIVSIVLFLVFFSPVLAYLAVTFSGGNTLLFEDALLHAFPFRVFLRNAFIHGFSPQWVPYSACGFSLLAEGQSGICFPTAQIIYRIFSAETGWIIEIIASHLVAFVFCFILLQHLRISRLSSLFGASVYAFCLFAFIMIACPSIKWCYSLLPAIFLAGDRFMKGRSCSSIFLVIVIALLLLTGHPPLIVYTGMMLFVFCLFHAVNMSWRERTIRRVGVRFLVLGGVACIAILIASPQLLPILQQYSFSARTTGTGSSVEALQNTLHIQPSWLPLSLFPTPFYLHDWGFWSFNIRYPYYALFLAFIGMLFGAKGLHRRYFISLFVFSILMALGPYVGLWKLVHSLPVLQNFRYPFRWLFFLPICISFLSAYGMDRLINQAAAFPGVGFRRVAKSILIIGLAIEVIVIVLYHKEFLQHTLKALECSPWLTGLLWLCGIGMVIAVFLSLGSFGIRQGVVLGISLTVISLFATLAFQIQDPIVIRNLERIGWKWNDFPNKPQIYRTSSALSTYGIWLTNTIEHHYDYTPNLTVLNGGLTTGHYITFFPYWSANVSTWCQEALKGDQKKEIYLNLSSARWLIVPDVSSSERSTSPAESFKEKKAYENPNAMSRASVVSSYRIFSNERDLVGFLESSDDFDPRRELAILKQDAEAWILQPESSLPRGNAPPPKATIVIDRPDRIEIELKPPVPSGAFLILSDTYYPGWRVSVDGVEEKVLRANYAFRGVKLPEGAKYVVFFFDPLVPDAALALPTIVLAALGVTLGLRHYLQN